MNPRKYNFAMNDPFDMDAEIKLVVPKIMTSLNFMKSIKELTVKRIASQYGHLGKMVLS